MNIQFDTSNTSQSEARGLIALLSSLLVQSTFTVEPIPEPVADVAPIAFEPKPHIAFVGEIKAAQPAQPAQPEPSPSTGVVAQPDAQPTPAVVATEQPAKRHRRTKAEIEADEAAAKQAPAVTEAPASTAVAETKASENKAVDAEELRFLLNGYIAKHSMEEAIGQLQTFGCNRVTEALALDPVKLNGLAEALRG